MDKSLLSSDYTCYDEVWDYLFFYVTSEIRKNMKEVPQIFFVFEKDWHWMQFLNFFLLKKRQIYTRKTVIYKIFQRVRICVNHRNDSH